MLFGGSIFALFAGIYYWLPKFTGKLLNEDLGQVQFWLMLIGFNLTFFPMHMSGLLGMPRRIYNVLRRQGWDLWNLMSTIGAFTIAASVALFIINFIYSMRRGEKAGNDPWDGRTLEWTIPSPPPAYNFTEIPHVHALDDFWHQKYTEDATGRPLPAVAGGGERARGRHGEHRRARHPPAVAVVLPAYRGDRIADHARPASSTTTLSCRLERRCCSSAFTAGRSSPPRKRRTTLEPRAGRDGHTSRPRPGSTTGSC